MNGLAGAIRTSCSEIALTDNGTQFTNPRKPKVSAK